MLVQLVSFGILLLLLKKYAFGPLVNMMAKRQEGIRNDIELAEKNRKEAEQYLKEQQEAIQKARLEAHQMIENAKATSVAQAEEILSSAKSEAERLKDQAVREIQLEKDQAVAALREQIGSLSVLLASKIIEKELDMKTQSDLIDQFMKEVGKSV